MLRTTILSAILLIISLSAFAQGQDSLSFKKDIDYTAPQKYVVGGVNISGLKFLDAQTLVNLFGVDKGESVMIPGDAISKGIKKLWKQGLFSDINVTIEKVVADTVNINIDLVERPRVSKIFYEGVKKSEQESLKEKMTLRVGDQLTEYLLSNGTNTIKKFYGEKGYRNAAVNVVQVNDTVIANGVRVTFEVDKKKKVKISDITFDGNIEVSDRKLRGAMKKTHRKDINIFKSAKFVAGNYEEDKENVITYYNEKGYRDAKVISDSIYVVNDKRIGLVIKVHEGPRYYFRNITWVGNTKYPSDFLSAVMKIKKGDVYDKGLLEKRLSTDENSVSTLYMDDGYLFFNVEPTEVKVDNDSIDVEMRIYEGKQATISKVLISGNTKTNEHVIRREIWTKPGELFSKSDIMRTNRELAQMGHFDPEKMNVIPMPNQADGTVDLKYILEEKPNDQLEVSGGWGANMFVGTIGIRFTNFSARRIFEKGAWRPVPSGDSQSLALRAQTNGSYYKAFSLSFQEPWLGGKKPTSLSVSLYHTIQNNSSYLYQASSQYMKVTGASVGIGTRLKWPDNYFTLMNELSYQNYNLKGWSGFLFDDGQSNIISFKTTFARNSSDQPIYPRRGSNFSLSVQFTPPYSLFTGKNYKEGVMLPKERYKFIEYHKWAFRSTWYNQLAGDLVLSTNVQFGYLGYYNNQLGYSPFEGFDLGGDGMSGYNLYGKETIGLRGYENSTLTPYFTSKISGKTVRVGNIYNKFTAELRYPLVLSPSSTIYGLAFVEGGNAWYNFADFSPFTIKRSAGVGLRLFLPMLGQLGIDWGYGFDEVPDSPGAGGSNFHFVIGMPF
jgi:outer membrane protein insertion porin family